MACTKENVCPTRGMLVDTLKNKAWMEKEFSDITVVVGERRFPLHRLVVCESPLFKELFLGEWKDVSRRSFTLRVEDSNVTPEAFEAVAGTMYGRDLNLTTDNAKGLYATASLLRMSDLAHRCVEYIAAHLTLDNVVSYSHFATEQVYLHVQRLVDGVARYYMRHVPELRTQLVDVPLQVLRDMLKSDHLAVASETERFMLVSAVFAEKMDCSWTYLEVGDGLEHGDDEKWVELDDEEFRDCPLKLSSHPAGGDPTLQRSFDFEFRNEEVAEVQIAFRDVLCTGIRYEHLSDEDALEVWTKIRELGMPCVVQAFQRGMFDARLLKMAVQRVRSEETGCTAVSALREEGTSTFRFGCELPDVGNLGVHGGWESCKRFYAGSNWWLKVEGKGSIGSARGCACLGVRVCCQSADGSTGDYENCLTPHVRATVICGDTVKTVEKDGADWLAHSDFVLPASDVEKCTTRAGSLRFVVLIQLVLTGSGMWQKGHRNKECSF